MDFLFIHGNYPAQFRHLAPLIAGAGHRVVFLTKCADAEKYAQPGIEIREYSLHRRPHKTTHPYLLTTEESVLEGQAVLREINTLAREGFTPRFIITHAGNGLGLFIKDILPHTLHIGYFEWFFRPETTQYLTKQFDLDVQLSSGLRNLPILQELERCDIAVVPTEWQKKQFPEAYQQKLNVIFDGIDQKFFKLQSAEGFSQNKELTIHNRDTGEVFSIPDKSKVISYATRGMETLRGFPEFMRALPSLLKNHPNSIVVLAGSDRRAYSYDAPSHNGSWKQHLLAELEGQLPLERVLFTGLLDYNDYRNLLWRSDLHCYFTRPYVTSWSLFEAAACGAKLAVSRSPATSEIVIENSVIWVELEDQNVLNSQLAEALEQPSPRAQLQKGFDLESSLQQWEQLLNQALQNS